jgi:hypothetical protein
VDLDNNGVLDCTETLAANTNFNVSAAGWTAEFGISLAWSPIDASGSAQASGSLAVDFTAMPGAGSVQAAASQCAQVRPGSGYELLVQTMLAPNQSTSGQAGAGLWFYASADCTGPIGSVQQGPIVSPGGAWQTLKMTTPQVPAGANSVALRLIIMKQGTQGPLTWLFDNVLFKRL